jgi:hypothetical protein
MPGWLTLVFDLDPDAGRREQLLTRLRSLRPINQTALRQGGTEVGSLVSLPKEALKGAKEATEGLNGRARAVRVDADMLAADPSSGTAAFVFLAADPQGNSMDHDDRTIAGAIHAYLGQYIPILGPRFVAVSTLLDRIAYAGALTAFAAGSEDEAHQLAIHDPWQRIYPGRVFETASNFFQRRLPPPGPGTQRSGGGSPWPFHWPV